MVLGRDIFGKIKTNWEDIFNLFTDSEVSSNSNSVSLNKIILEYRVVISIVDELGILKDFEADIPIDPQVNPKYFCARLVPYGKIGNISSSS